MCTLLLDLSCGRAHVNATVAPDYVRPHYQVLCVRLVT